MSKKTLQLHSTVDTDYILVKKHTVDLAITALKKDGYNVIFE
ncbi:hypothetical protein PNIG_a1772 [Pseudoalteromonas nigrifaciens]|uniref:Orphan protein n=2 Tax=Pseudoalteromonas TaxID=53246 RepID=Q3IL17_PSET1|nr:hypothetical protein PNIG_a1772 [Pseudoalteromonas nigrifaciens]CAI86409.1 putative orphan protein [Pseudoalteromonas translucida]SJN26966.1 putative orphan protein [Pseudoalteromonas sp. JB197]|tara:strand:- start:359 stop:484 length:126 start_codon:yes stop_codon:yes gene_type:complete